jgi:D-hexose-6-phosphate mutarotase
MQNQLERFNIPGHVAIVAGNGGLPKISVTTPSSAAEIYLQGAHVTAFQKTGEPPLLWMSERSLFTPGKAIRGGVPICFPWFGAREGKPAHGFARIVAWELTGSKVGDDGSVHVTLRLPEEICRQNDFAGRTELTVTVGETLTMELTVANPAAAPLEFEACLHSYFTVGDIATTTVRGLQGCEFLDKVDGGARKREADEVIRIAGEVDRVYLATPAVAEIGDETLGRVIRVEQTGGRSTVVWNPWVAKARAMADFGDEEFRGMICVESGGVAENKIVVAPSAAATLRVVLGSAAT